MNKTGKKLAVSGVGKTRDDVMAPKVNGPNPHAGLGPNSGALLVTHGKTQTVSTSDLLGSGVEEVRGRGVGGRGRGRGGKDIPQKKLKQQRQRKATITESEDDEEEKAGRGVGGVQRPWADVTGSELVGAEASEESEGLVMRLDKKFCHSDSHSSLVSYQYSYKHNIIHVHVYVLSSTVVTVPVLICTWYSPNRLSYCQPNINDFKKVICQLFDCSSIHKTRMIACMSQIRVRCSLVSGMLMGHCDLEPYCLGDVDVEDS